MRDTADGPDASNPTDPQLACFEAGIKFGSLYHQFAGTPVSPASAHSLAAAMEDAIENQPHCESVAVAIREDELAEAVADGPAEYTELTGRFFEVELHIAYEDTEVVAEMAMADGYPLMELAAVRERN